MPLCRGYARQHMRPKMGAPGRLCTSTHALLAVSIAAQAHYRGYVMASDLQSRTLRVRGAGQHDLPTGQHWLCECIVAFTVCM
jgi:hypothetical protein